MASHMGFSDTTPRRRWDCWNPCTMGRRAFGCLIVEFEQAMRRTAPSPKGGARDPGMGVV